VRLAEPRGKAALEFAARPMLGCIGVAPEGEYSPRSGPAGYWGGNLDFNLIREGATVLLPVFHPGGLLFFGDGHALQGDGEAIGSGVETSLDVTVTVRLRKGWTIPGPRVETAEEIVSIGAKPEAKLNETMEMATRDMLAWLVKDHGVEPWEAHLLLGVAGRYDLITLGGSVGVRIPRAALPSLPPCC
jgi:acetamidase/formamidase